MKLMKKFLQIMLLLFAVSFSLSCELADLGGDDDDTEDPGGGSSGNMYGNWVRENNAGTYLKFSGSTAVTCVNGTTTTGTFNAGEPSMTFVIQGNKIKFPLRFSSKNLMVGVPDQAITTHNAQLYLRTDKFCGTGSGGGGGTGGGGTGGGSTTGNAMFWTSSDLGCGNITVKLNNSSQIISSYFGSIPNCGASGSANYALPAGTYAYTASCSKYNWSGSINVVAGQCSRMQLTK